MNKLVALVLLAGMLLVSVPVMADETDDPNWVYSDPIVSELLNHKHSIDDEHYGAGFDVVVFESQNPLLEELTVEGRFDFHHEAKSVYLVGRANLFQAVKGLFE